jgi:hypothetical protein
MLGASLVFGLCSFNIFFLVQANVTLVLDYGIMALLDGAFAELLLLTYLWHYQPCIVPRV